MKTFLNDVIILIKRYAKNAVTPIIIINIILSIIAVIRDIAMASYLGTTIQADALLMAFFIPDMIGTSLLAVTIVASCVPVYSKLILNKKENITQCMTFTTLFMFILPFLVFIFCFINKDNIIIFFASGFNKETQILCSEIFVILLPVIVLAPIAATGNSYLQAYGFFKLSAFAPVVYNSIYLSGISFVIIMQVSVSYGVYIIAYCILLSVLSMSILTWGGLFKYSIRIFEIPRYKAFIENKNIVCTSLKQIIYNFFPYLLILLFTQSIFFSERYLAAHLGVGAIAGLNYAYRLAQFPIWVFVAAVGMVILPSLSRSRGLGKTDEFALTFKKSLWLVLIISLPFSIILHVLRVPIVSILLQRGVFNNESLVITSGVLKGYSLAIVGLAAQYICHRACLAIGNMVLPLCTTFLTAIISISVNFLLVKMFGLSGLGYGLAVGVTIDSIVLLFVLKKKMRLTLKNSGFKLIKIVIANLFVIIIAVIFNAIWYIWPQENSFLLKILYAVLVVAVTGIAYIGSLRYSKII